MKYPRKNNDEIKTKIYQIPSNIIAVFINYNPNNSPEVNCCGISSFAF